jgi:DNA-directed RNA polymerase beta subunit
MQRDQSKLISHGKYLKGEETAVVQQVTKIGERATGNALLPTCQKVNVLLRFNRSPVIGDKFASRAGQVCEPDHSYLMQITLC